jgi:hypothetical protein
MDNLTVKRKFLFVNRASLVLYLLYTKHTVSIFASTVTEYMQTLGWFLRGLAKSLQRQFYVGSTATERATTLGTHTLFV